MKITKIEQQKKDKARYNIFVDGEFLTGISEDTLVKFGLRKGDEIEPEKLDEIDDQEMISEAKHAAYEYLSYKPRTKSEVIRKLRSKKFPTEIIEDSIKLLEEQKYIDDQAYARDYVNSKLVHKPVGKELLKRKLLQKGVDKQLISDVLDELIDEKKKYELANEALAELHSKSFEGDLRKFRERSYRHMILRGFESDIAIDVINRFIDERDLGKSAGNTNKAE